MVCEPHWTAYATAFLTLIVAVLGSIVAFRQWKTAQNKLKLDLFEKRLAMYSAVTGFLVSILSSGTVTSDELRKFSIWMREAKWLLDPSIADYLEAEIYHRAIYLQCKADELEGMPDGDERSANVSLQSEMKKLLADQFSVLDTLFSDFLTLRN